MLHKMASAKHAEGAQGGERCRKMATCGVWDCALGEDTWKRRGKSVCESICVCVRVLVHLRLC